MNTRIPYFVVAFVLLASHRGWSQATTVAEPAETKATSNYLRVISDENEDPTAMQTSVVPFRPRSSTGRQDVQVDLIGAVHVADEEYFAKLNKLFKEYDAVLYELVAPEHSNVPDDGRSQHPVGQMQQGLKTMLDLAFQLEEIDYKKKNFVHADMSPEEFARVMNERNESFLQLMLRMMGQAMATQTASGRGSDADFLFALFSRNRSLRLKRVMATQFENLEGAMQAIEGPDGSTLIGQRNKKALSVLRRELAAGKRRIAIFYGAGHMPDMAERLEKGFDMQADTSSIQWLTAWDMSE